MNSTIRFLATVAFALLSAGAVFAQSASGAAPAPGTPPAPQVRSVGGIDYINGGAGTEARDAITAMQAGFGLKLVFSNPSGEYLVVDHVSVKGRAGEVFDVDRAGPWLLVKLPPGHYTVMATMAGKTVQQTVDVGSTMRTLNWRFAAA